MELYPLDPMAPTFSIEKLNNCLSDEKRTGELIPLQEDFYTDAMAYEKTGIPDDENGRRLKENYDKLLNTLKTKRIQKILIYLAYGRQPPTPIPLEEQRLFKKVKTVLEEETAVQKEQRIRILTDIPALMTPDGSSVGPYKKDEIVDLKKETERSFILKNKIGEIIG